MRSGVTLVSHVRLLATTVQTACSKYPVPVSGARRTGESCQSVHKTRGVGEDATPSRWKTRARTTRYRPSDRRVLLTGVYTLQMRAQLLPVPAMHSHPLGRRVGSGPEHPSRIGSSKRRITAVLPLVYLLSLGLEGGWHHVREAYWSSSWVASHTATLLQQLCTLTRHSAFSYSPTAKE